MTVVEDAITTEEVLVVVLAVKEKALVAEEVLVVAVSAAIEVQRLEAVALDQEEKVDFLTELLVKVVLEEEANQEVHQLLKEKADFHPNALLDVQMHLDQADFLKELQDAPKVLQMHHEKEDQERANSFC
jgi:hypothetical protein